MAQQPIKVTVTSSIHRQTTEAMKLYDSNTQRHLDRVANELRNQVLRGMKTTKKQSVGYSRGKGKKLHYPSVVGSPPAIDTGRLINSIHIVKAMPFQTGDEHSASVFTNVWYAINLEQGNMVGKRPFMGEESQAYKNAKQYARDIASDISIKTTLPKPATTGVKIR